MEKIQQLNYIKANATLLHDDRAIQKALDILSQKLNQDYADKLPLFLTVMNGGLVFSGQLLVKLNFPIQLDYCHASRYRGDSLNGEIFSGEIFDGQTFGGKIDWKIKPTLDLKDRHVVILDDILDEGITLQAIIDYCLSQSVKSVKTCVLIEKLHDRKVIENMRPDYCELKTDDHYVFGYGMDANHFWRNANGIYILNQ